MGPGTGGRLSGTQACRWAVQPECQGRRRRVPTQDRQAESRLTSILLRPAGDGRGPHPGGGAVFLTVATDSNVISSRNPPRHGQASCAPAAHRADT